MLPNERLARGHPEMGLDATDNLPGSTESG